MHSDDFITSDDDGLFMRLVLGDELAASDVLQYRHYELDSEVKPSWIDVTSNVDDLAVGLELTELTSSSMIEFRLGDAAGNFSEPISQQVIIDTSAPDVDITLASIGEDSGVDSDFITNDSDGLTINGSLSSDLATGDVLQYSIDDWESWLPVSVNDDLSFAFDASTLTSTSTAKFRVSDLAGNTSDVAEQHIVVDSVAPTVQITASRQLITVDKSLAVNFSFSEPVLGFSEDDVLVSGGELSGFVDHGTDKSFSASFTPRNPDKVKARISIPGPDSDDPDSSADGFSDVAGNDNEVVTSLDLTINRRPKRRNAFPHRLGRFREDQQHVFNKQFILELFDDDDLNDVLSLEELDVDPDVGVLFQDENGDFTFVPVGNVNGTFDFTCRIADGKGGHLTHSLALAIEAVNDKPVFDQTLLASLSGCDEGQSFRFKRSELLKGYSDIDGDTLSVSGLAVKNQKGRLEQIDADTWEYVTPDPDFNGLVELTYSVDDDEFSLPAVQSFQWRLSMMRPVTTSLLWRLFLMEENMPIFCSALQIFWWASLILKPPQTILRLFSSTVSRGLSSPTVVAGYFDPRPTSTVRFPFPIRLAMVN